MLQLQLKPTMSQDSLVDIDIVMVDMVDMAVVMVDIEVMDMERGTIDVNAVAEMKVMLRQDTMVDTEVPTIVITGYGGYDHSYGFGGYGYGNLSVEPGYHGGS